MAIQKEKIVNGVTGDFWVTHSVELSPDKGMTRAIMHLYADQAAYVSGGIALHAQEVILIGGDNPCKMLDLAGLVEAKLITMPGDFVSGVAI